MKKIIDFSPPFIEQEEIDAVVNTLKNGWLTLGEKTIEFENKFAEYIGSKYAIAVNSCTSALFLSLKVLGIKQGDEVIVPVNTFSATANVVEHCNAIPIFIDINNETFVIDTQQLESKITEKTKAIIAVHFAGIPCDMDKINEIAKKHNLLVIEDCAHAAGSTYNNGKKVGNSENLCCFSFYATKNITTGEGGMITTNNPIYTSKLKELGFHGISKDAWNRYDKKGNWEYDVIAAGYKFNTTDLNSSLGFIQLKKLDAMNNKRKELVKLYNKLLPKNIKKIPFFENSSHHLFVILVEKRNELIEYLKENNIVTSVHFKPLHLTSFYKNKYSLKPEDFPNATNYFKQCLSLPLHPRMTEEDVIYVVEKIKEFYK